MQPRRLTHGAGVSQTLAVAVGVALAGCASGGRGPASVEISVEEWSGEGLTGRRFTTEHFDIISTLHDAEFEALLPTFLETAFKRYEATFSTAANVDIRLTTYIFGSRSEWTRFARRRFPARYDVYSRIRAGGFTEGDTSVSFHPNRAAALATLAHEGWHQYVGARVKAAIPAWLNEGLACYHEAVDFAGAEPRFRPQRNSFRINSLREAIHQNRLMPLKELISTDAGQVISRYHGGIAQGYYAQAWALITYLRHGADGRHAGGFRRMINDIADGTFQVRTGAARIADRDGVTHGLGDASFLAYFGHTPDELAMEYHEHVLRVAGFAR